MVNSYPRWEIEKNFGRLINQQLRTQPGKPLISGELQGGWMSEVGGKLSWEQDGLMPIQTQNITLYALQRGFCGITHPCMCVFSLYRKHCSVVFVGLIIT